MILDNGKARNYNNLHCRYEFSHKFSQIPAVGSKVVMVGHTRGCGFIYKIRKLN